MIESWQVFFAFLVAIGVGGEFALGWVHIQKGKRLHKIEQIEDGKRQETIETLRNENLKLQKFIQEPRRIDFASGKAQEILEKGAKCPVEIVWVGNPSDFTAESLENFAFAGQINALLKISGWTVSQSRAATGLHRLMSGVAVEIKEGWNDPNVPGNTLFSALSECVPKGQMKRATNSGMPDNSAVIVVGPKF